MKQEIVWKKADRHGIRHCDAGKYQGYYSLDNDNPLDSFWRWGVSWFNLGVQCRCQETAMTMKDARKQCSDLIRAFHAEDENNSK